MDSLGVLRKLGFHLSPVDKSADLPAEQYPAFGVLWIAHSVLNRAEKINTMRSRCSHRGILRESFKLALFEA